MNRLNFRAHASLADQGIAALRLLAVACAFIAACVVAVHRAGADNSKTGRQWAFLIGVDKYENIPRLHYTINDVQQLVITLRSRGGYTDDSVFEMLETDPKQQFHPRKFNIERQLPKFLAKIGAGDTVMVYFTGHGFRDNDKKMYLAPIDCDPNDLVKTGISVEWFRKQIAECNATSKVLILDSCHAGSEKGAAGGKSAVADDLNDSFKEMKGVVTLASCTAQQKSQMWDDKQQSLFTYWLNQGLRGQADYDGDGQVTIDELYRYAEKNVTRTADARFPLQQTPVRIVRSETVGVPVVAKLQPLSLRQVIIDIAEQLTDAMTEKKVEKVGVLEFVSTDEKLAELLGANFGILGKYCADELERRLTDRGQDNFKVIDGRRLQTILREQNFTIGDLWSSTGLQQVSQKAGGLPVIALGKFMKREGRKVNIDCTLLRTDTHDKSYSTRGVAELNDSEWAMIGRSAAVGPSVAEAHVVKAADAKAEGPHPLSDPSFAYPVKIMIGNNERKPIFRNNDCIVPMRRGETFEIWVENRSGKMTFMRLLVDGLNTLPQKVETKGVIEEIWAKRVNLDEARHWFLDPSYATLNAVRGFASKVGEHGEIRPFVIVDIEKSLAARQKFTDSVGLITAAFYEQAPKEEPKPPPPAPRATTRGGIAVDAGKPTHEPIPPAPKGIRIGKLVAVVNIRYVDADTLETR